MFGKAAKIKPPEETDGENNKRGRETNQPRPLSACLSVSVICPRRTPCQSERADGKTAGTDKTTGDETICPVCFRIPRRLLIQPQAYIAENANRERHTDGMRNGRNGVVDDEEHRGNLSACLFPFDTIYITASRQGTGREQGNSYSQHDCVEFVMMTIHIYERAALV